MRRRAGVIAIRDGEIALIERVRDGRRYWVLPGGGIEAGETAAQAAAREAREELGVDVELGPMLVELLARHPDGTPGHHLYFAASLDNFDIRVVGPELEERDRSGTYCAVWVGLDALASMDVRPPEIATLIVRHRDGRWPEGLRIEVSD